MFGPQANRTLSSVVARTRRAPPTCTRRRLFSVQKKPTSRKISSATAPKQAAAVSLTTAPPRSSNLISNTLPTALLQNDKILPILGNAGYMALASGFLMTDMLELRVALIGGYTGLVAFHSLHERPLKIPLRWSAVFVAVNAVAACLLIQDRYAPEGSLNSAEHENGEELYREHFEGQVTRGQFKQLLALAQRRTVPAGTLLTRENLPHDKMYFLVRGQARVHHGSNSNWQDELQLEELDRNNVATIEEGGFVNDVAFQRGPNVGAYGTVVTAADTNEVLSWDLETLRAHLKSRPEMERNVKYCMSNHLVKSLLRQRDARQQQQQQR